MSGEEVSDPYLAKRRANAKFLADEEAFFEVWFQLQRHQEWKRLYPDEQFRENWGMGFRDAMWKGWHARAGFHVSYARNPGTDK